MKNIISNTYSRKFRGISTFESEAESIYFLLPFKFHSISIDREVLVNEIGDYLIVPQGTAKAIVHREIDFSSNLYRDLVANFFISPTPVPELLNVISTRYRTKKKSLGSFTSLHIFVVTLRCNHSCHYCQVSRAAESKSEFDISYKDLDAGINHMFLSPSEELTVEFQGGEPLLAFDKVRYAVERIQLLNEDFKKEISYVICTNSTILNDEILLFCKNYNILISTSLDGPAFIHNANRFKSGRASYDLVIEGIDRTRQALGHDKVSALMTTTALSLKYPKEIIDNYVENGFGNIFLRPISPYGFALKNQKKNHYQTAEFLDFYKQGLEHILNLNAQGVFFKEDYTSIILQKILTPFTENYVDLQSPTGLVSSVIVFNYDGFVYASDESRMLAEIKDYTFQLGHVTQPYEELFLGDKAKQILNNGVAECLAGCSDCAFLTYCGADPVLHYATQNDMQGHRAFSIFCKKNMEIIRYLFEMLDIRKGYVESTFQSWIHKPAA
ncbi:His-Xaa-Ser system radical SAM maturase HxsB [Dyadobacter psychrophilus]|uniref:His-Xaa-Ser system radical SAM maturase HxsB n=1 Tax=Dyadobacter psychrophilus TaxID=651661 RepID=A0A1T5G4E1_9BACT|nr:His-Xaa-Ser system radical SAM maturase HxsB [Dyadobacter psychrophilus]SKC03300.1 His-Xaa-Ser system radical SAM maturase HxsB [Dyadobacter psychrophilus]